MISALADAGAAFGRADYLAAAVACRGVHRGRAARTPTARCCARSTAAARSSRRSWRITPTCSRRTSSLYESTFDERWFVRAVELAETILIRFHDPELGGFFSTSTEHTGLIARRKDLEDAPIPAGASAACFGLLRLARLTGESSYEDGGALAGRAAAPDRAAPPARVRPPPAGDRLPARAGPRGRAGGRRRLRACARSSGAAITRTWCWRAARRRAPCRCSRAANRWTGAPPPTCASTSRASCR